MHLSSKNPALVPDAPVASLLSKLNALYLPFRDVFFGCAAISVLFDVNHRRSEEQVNKIITIL